MGNSEVRHQNTVAGRTTSTKRDADHAGDPGRVVFPPIRWSRCACRMFQKNRRRPAASARFECRDGRVPQRPATRAGNHSIWPNATASGLAGDRLAISRDDRRDATTRPPRRPRIRCTVEKECEAKLVWREIAVGDRNASMRWDRDTALGTCSIGPMA